MLKKDLIHVYYAETHDFSYAFWPGVAFIANNILLLCGDFKTVGWAKGSLQNLMPNNKTLVFDLGDARNARRGRRRLGLGGRRRVREARFHF